MSVLLTNEFRPKTLDELVLPENMLSVFQKYLEEEEIPHLLFYGPPGTGKTSTALVLANSICKSDADFMFINASLERGIDSMRNKITEFLSTPPMVSNIKILLLDEADNLTQDALKSLRSLMENEQFNKMSKTRFILTVNYENRLIDAILSRLTKYHFNKVPIDELLVHLKRILKKKKVSFKDEDLEQLVIDLHPDVRSILNYISKFTIVENSEFIYDKNSVVSPRQELYKKLSFIVDKIQKEEDLSSALVDDFITVLLENEDYIVDAIKLLLEKDNLKPQVFVLCNRYLNTMKNVVSIPLHTQAMLYDIMMIMKHTKRLYGIE